MVDNPRGALEGDTVRTEEVEERTMATAGTEEAALRRPGADREVSGEPAMSRFKTAAERLAMTLVRTEQLTNESARILGLAKTAPATSGARNVVPLAEAARLSGRHPDLLRRWCATGRIEGIRVGRTWAVTQREVDRLSGLPARRRHRSERAER